ncbi:MAG: Holliday junction branch migration protein RuvA [Anaerosomatales bacterium]|nr:Holliday junction branch migration protein RuvA [Anaerosomatales bacterium]MDT8433156.1 Holliday junction branch migration protein RuvA [Anaerosomatales bacterium]
MIDFVTGRIADKGPAHCVLEVGGVGLRLAMSTGSLAALPHVGDTVTVFTHLHVREDELSLFGFESAAEKDLFERLITVSGVGPKVALAALSSYEPAFLTDAITGEDVAVVSSIPGIGAKTAQRIILELKDKLAGGGSVGGRAVASTGVVAEARDALLGMGFSAAEAATALKGAPADASAGLLVKHALKRLGGARR